MKKRGYLLCSLLMMLALRAFSQKDSLWTSFESFPLIYHDYYWPNTLYSWTTEEQVLELKESKTLLKKSISEKYGPSLFDTRIQNCADSGNQMAKMIQEPQFAKKRFAWVNGWATVRGWPGESYGNQLIKIVLSDSAIIGKFDTNEEVPFQFLDMKGNKLSEDYVLRNKHRLAVIYHLNFKEGMRLNRIYRHGTYNKPTIKNTLSQIPYREYVVINESMIKYWSTGTSDILEEMSREVDFLQEQIDFAKGWEKDFIIGIQEWTHDQVYGERYGCSYFYLKCFDNNFYVYYKKNLKRILRDMAKAKEAQVTKISRP